MWGICPHLFHFWKKNGAGRLHIVKMDSNYLLVDENKDFCVCPIANNIQGKASGKLCNCSEKFADQIFSRVCQKNISAKVKRSVLRDGQSCIYEISGL